MYPDTANILPNDFLRSYESGCLGYIKVAANIAPTVFQLCVDAEGYLVVYQSSRQYCAKYVFA